MLQSSDCWLAPYIAGIIVMEVYNIREHVRIGKSKIFKITIFLREAKVESSCTLNNNEWFAFDVETNSSPLPHSNFMTNNHWPVR